MNLAPGQEQFGKKLSFLKACDSAEMRRLREAHRFKSVVGDIVAKLLNAPWWLSLIYVFIMSVVLMAGFYFSQYIDLSDKQRYVYHLDLFAYTTIYSAWFVVCLPKLLVTLNLTLLLQILIVLLKLFFAEAAVVLYSWYRGHLNILRAGIGLVPPLDADRPGVGLSWLGETGYNLRLATLLSCAIVSLGIRVANEWKRRCLLATLTAANQGKVLKME